MRINSFFTKLIIIFTALLLTYLYAQYERNKYYNNDSLAQNVLLLKKLPNFNTVQFETGLTINSESYLQNSSGLFVHIWGSWCGPCEKEMPPFLAYAESLNTRGVKFLLVAVNDEELKVKKFMSRYKVPTNVAVVIDNQNAVMDLFGTLKVPETFLFDRSGRHINKFVGPQEWLQESYKTRLDYWLSPQNSVERKIETH